MGEVAGAIGGEDAGFGAAEEGGGRGVVKGGEVNRGGADVDCVGVAIGGWAVD